MRDRPAIPHRRIKQLAMVVLQWHWLTSRGGVLRANPSTEDSCGVRCRDLYPAVTLLRDADGLADTTPTPQS
jgi:hypothetical protein